MRCSVARPLNDEITQKHDRIIAKVYSQLYRWGFSSREFESKIAKVAYEVLGRANTKQVGNKHFACDEDILREC
jgi:hypothetical protein